MQITKESRKYLYKIFFFVSTKDLIVSKECDTRTASSVEQARRYKTAMEHEQSWVSCVPQLKRIAIYIAHDGRYYFETSW